MDDSVVACLACGREDLARAGRRDEVAYCGACVFALQAVPPRDPGGLYSRGTYDDWQLRRARLTAYERFYHDVAVARRRCAALGDVLPPSGVWLDYGCGNGATLAVARQRGYHPVGVELHEEYAAEVRRNLLAEVHTPDALVRRMSSIAVATAFDVLEHLLDPVGLILTLLNTLERRTTPGVLVLETPDLAEVGPALDGWRHYRPDEHLTYWSERAFDRLLAPGGALSGRARKLHVARPLPGKLQVVLGWAPPGGGS